MSVSRTIVTGRDGILAPDTDEFTYSRSLAFLYLKYTFQAFADCLTAKGSRALDSSPLRVVLKQECIGLTSELRSVS